MEKITKFIKQKENILVFLLIVFSLLGSTLCITLSNGDELWAFQNVYKIYNGFQIYEDANVICTPLFFFVGNFIFHILGANFFVFRIYSIIIFSAFYFLTYKILRELKINRKISITFLLIIIMFGNFLLSRVMANYNSLALTFCLLGIYLLISRKTKLDKKGILVQSLICFFVAMTKQNIGLFYAIALSIIILVIKPKKKIKEVLEEIRILLFLSLIFLLFLNVNGLLSGFMNYCVLGIKQFATDNLALNWEYIIIVIPIILLNILTSLFLVKKTNKVINEEEKYNLIVLNSFAFFLVFLVFPIVNATHSFFALYLSLILLLYIVFIILNKAEINIAKYKLVTILMIGLILIDIFANIYMIVVWGQIIFNKDYYYEYSEPFYGSVVSEELYKNIENVTNYIKEKEQEGKNVIVFSSKAALYMVPLKESNGCYDLPFYGNFGTLDDEDIINDIRQRKNTIILIEKKNDDYIRWQEPEKVMETLENDLIFIGKIEEFNIYIP